MTKKYPLEPLRRVRESRVDGAKRALFEASQMLERSRGELARREREKAEIEQNSQRTRAREDELLAGGELAVADLMRGAAWAVGAELRKKEKAEKVEQARGVVVKASHTVDDRRTNVEKAQADSEVVEKNRERWERAALARAIDAEEQAAEEAHLSRTHARSKR